MKELKQIEPFAWGYLNAKRDRSVIEIGCR